VNFRIVRTYPAFQHLGALHSLHDLHPILLEPDSTLQDFIAMALVAPSILVPLYFYPETAETWGPLYTA
jgi:hypothetical protein